MRRKILVSLRGSKCAPIEADPVVARIREINPDIKYSIVKVITSGGYNWRCKIEHTSGGRDIHLRTGGEFAQCMDLPFLSIAFCLTLA